MKKHFFRHFFVIVIFFSSFTDVFASFPDLPSTYPFYEAIQYAQSNGFVSGYPDGTFKANRPVNRAEFVKIVVGASPDYNPSYNFSGYDVYLLSDLQFSDIESKAWYTPYLRFAVRNNVISGYPDGTFRPDKNISFVEAAKVILRAFRYEVPSDSLWYKPYVEKLAQLHAIPLSITHFDHTVTRGEMIEMIYRIRSGVTSKATLTYENFQNTMSSSDFYPISIQYNPPPIQQSLPPNQYFPPVQLSPPPVESPPPPVQQAPSVQQAPGLSTHCTVFPVDNLWNRDISQDPVDAHSDAYLTYITNLGGKQFLHADFGGDGMYGIPYVFVDGGQTKVPVVFVDYPDESDPGPYPIPVDAPIENGGDRHLIVVDPDECKLYELYAAEYMKSQWYASNGAVFDLGSNALRPDGWTSADAAGLPIFPGLVKYDEVSAGSIRHALRFTLSSTQKAYISPATHQAGNTKDPSAPPMGLRLRLKRDYDISSYTGQSRIILEALKKYGMFLADNGSNWYISGAQDSRWDDDDLNQLKKVPGSAFEVVQSGSIIQK